jgi:hypothetical protein
MGAGVLSTRLRSKIMRGIRLEERGPVRLMILEQNAERSWNGARSSGQTTVQRGQYSPFRGNILSVLPWNRRGLKELPYMCRCLFSHRDPPPHGWIAAATRYRQIFLIIVIFLVC